MDNMVLRKNEKSKTKVNWKKAFTLITSLFLERCTNFDMKTVMKYNR